MFLKLHFFGSHALDNVVGIWHHIVLATIEVLVVFRGGLELRLKGRKNHLHFICLLLFKFLKFFGFDNKRAVGKRHHVVLPICRDSKFENRLRHFYFVLEPELKIFFLTINILILIKYFKELDLLIETCRYDSLSNLVISYSLNRLLKDMDRLKTGKLLVVDHLH